MLYRTSIYTILILLLSLNLVAQQKYKKYRRSVAREKFVEFSYAPKHGSLTIHGDDSSHTFIFTGGDISRRDDVISIKNTPVLNRDGFLLSGNVYPVEAIDRIELQIDNGNSQIYFLKRGEQPSQKYRSRKKNRISVFDDIFIEKDQFIRGGIAAFWANITIDGEVNEDVAAVFGDITIGDRAVVRGNIVAVDGKVNISKDATIYGEVHSSGLKKKYRTERWRRWYRHEKDFSAILKFYYNRIDGAAPYLGVKFVDEDSLLPEVQVYAGYGFSSERWRYHIGLEQSFLLSYPITVGGSVYKKLRSGDDWLLSETDNTLFALIATQDYKDYYEAEGGYVFVRFTPYRRLTSEVGFLGEKYKWLEGHRELWSMFGGSKRFPANFSSVPEDIRLAGKDQIDFRELKSLNAGIGYDSRDEAQDFRESYWSARAEAEWAPDGWNDDYDFTRYSIRLAGFHTLNRYLGLFLGVAHGGSDGVLPLHRKFFIGGLGTLHGYEHKEFMGSEFWLGKIEYSVRFPKTDVSGLLFYNIARISGEPVEPGSAEAKQSIGIGISFEDNVRVDIARRLDRSDSSFKLNVSLGLYFWP